MGNFNQSDSEGGGSALGAEQCINNEGTPTRCLMQIEGSAYIKNLTTSGMRCATDLTNSSETDLCVVADEITVLRQTVASQETRIMEQDARIAKLERALDMFLQGSK